MLIINDFYVLKSLREPGSAQPDPNKLLGQTKRRMESRNHPIHTAGGPLPVPPPNHSKHVRTDRARQIPSASLGLALFGRANSPPLAYPSQARRAAFAARDSCSQLVPSPQRDVTLGRYFNADSPKPLSTGEKLHQRNQYSLEFGCQ